MAKFPFTIATVDQVLFDGEVTSVTAPGSAGELTILAHHTAVITTLQGGKVSIRIEKDSDKQDFEVSGGLLEVGNNRAIILV